jgi:hypothetical protein
MKTISYTKIYLEYLTYAVKGGRKNMYTRKQDIYYLFPASLSWAQVPALIVCAPL